MYLNIDLKNVKKEEVREVLKNIGVAFEEFNSSLEMFLKEEAEFRLESLLDDCKDDDSFLIEEDIKLLNKEEERKSVVRDIASEYFDSEIFDYDMLDNIRDRVVEEFLNKTYKADLYISKEDLREINIKLSIDDISKLEEEYVDGVKIESDYREVIGVVEFARKGCKMELVLCSGQTNYWLEANLITNYYLEYTTEPFFELEENTSIEMTNRYNTTFVANIKTK